MTENSRSSGAVLATVCLALGAVVATVASLNLAIPSFARDTGATQTQISWVIDAYALTFAALLLPAGALGDRYGRRRVLLVGLAIFALAAFSVMGLDTPVQVIGARAVMGLAAALVMPATLSTITGTFSEADRVKGVAVWAAVAGGSAILGLLATGTLLKWFEWQSVFVFTGLIAAFAWVLTWHTVPESADPQSAARDPLGAVLSAVGLFAIVYAIIEAPISGWTSASTLLWLAAGLVVTLGFLAWELVPERPILDPRLFRRGPFAAGTLSLTLQFFGFFGLVFVFLMYLQLVRGWSPLTTAASLLPVPLGLMPAARLAPRLVPRFGQALLCSFGLLVLAGGVLILSTYDASTPYWRLALTLWVLGLGMGTAMTPATTAVTDSLPRAEQGVASAMNDLSRELGGALGIAVLGSVLNSTYRAGIALPPQVPAHIAEAVRGSLAAALQIAERSPGHGPMLAAMARDAFQDGMTDAMRLAGVILAIGAAAVFTVMRLGDPGVRHTDQADPEQDADQAGERCSRANRNDSRNSASRSSGASLRVPTSTTTSPDQPDSAR